MKYRKDKYGNSLSILGFGCMRLPLTPEGAIDEPRAAKMLDRAYKAGVNYFDTAYFYHNRTSEEFVGRALKAYPRDSFYLATKYFIGAAEDYKACFEEQLANLQTDQKLDFMRRGLESALNQIRRENLTQIEEIRTTVDKKLQDTLDKKLSDSFAQVSQQLEHLQELWPASTTERRPLLPDLFTQWCCFSYISS